MDAPRGADDLGVDPLRRQWWRGPSGAAASWALVVLAVASVYFGRDAPAAPPEWAQGPVDTSMVDRAACPTAEGGEGAYARPRQPRRGEILDMEPTRGHMGWRVVRVDLPLPSGRLFENGGEYLGWDGTVTDLGPPRRARWFLFLARSRDGGERAAFAQLVLEPGRRPVRWTEDERFGFGTDGGMGAIGAPEAAAAVESYGEAASEVQREWIFEDRPCLAFAGPGGTRLVIFDNGYGDGYTPAAAGHDATGRLVAVTWFMGTDPWALGGFPGRPPRSVVRQTGCRRDLIGRGVARDESYRRCVEMAQEG